MGEPSIVSCFGELLWDFFDTEPKAEREPIGNTFRRELGGASANVAVTLARLGIKTSAVGAVGEDELGEGIVVALEREGVDVSYVTRVAARTGLTFVKRDLLGKPTFFPYRDGTADLRITETMVTPGAAKAKWGVVSSTSMLASTRAATEKFIRALDKAGGHLVVDLNARAHLWDDAAALKKACADLVGHATVVKASERDLAAVAGKRGMSWLEEHAKSATWVLTRGDNGAAAVGPHGKTMAPTKRVRVIDRAGAGDAFASGVIAVLVRSGVKPGSAEWKDDKLWTRALEIGHLLGAKAVSAVGATAGLADLADLKARLKSAKKG